MVLGKGEMKINIRTLHQKTFPLEIDPSDKISTLKQKIAEQQAGAPVERQKLIYAGRVLLDAEIVSHYQIGEGEMVVLMIIRPPTTSAAAKPAESVSKPEQPSSTSVQSAVQASVSPTASTHSQRPAVGTAPAAAFQVPDRVIESIIEMGFSREDATKALQASFGNPDRAVEYLLSGSIPVLEEESLPADGNDAAMFGSMASSPQFLESLNRLQQNPELLAAILGQIGERNPELLQAIQANPQAFIQTLQGLAASQASGRGMYENMAGEHAEAHNSEGHDDGSEFDDDDADIDADGHEISREEMQSILDRNASQVTHNVVHVTPEELEAINRLCSLGFDRARATEAYFVCDKNEEVAAAYLFEHMDE